MAAELLIQYFGDGVTTAFTVPAVTSGYMPFVEVDGLVVEATYTTNLFTFAVAPLARQIINVRQTNKILAAKAVQSLTFEDKLGAGTGVPAGASNSYLKTDTGTKTLALADPLLDRIVLITVNVTTAFANGDGAQPTLALGETSTVSKFAATTIFASKAVGSYTFAGVLSATKDLIATLVAGTGSTETGAFQIVSVVFPKP